MSQGTLIEAVALADCLPDCCVFDVRHQLADVDYGERAYLAGHIPGALFLHCDRDLSGAKTGSNGRHPLPDPAVLAGKLAACGVSSGTQVVVYDDSQGMIAGRLWWMLRWLGHPRVAVLNGGIQAWLAVGGSLSKEIPSPERGDFQAALPVGAVDAAYVLAHLESSAMRLIDARSPDRFRGENESLDPLGGHIPGATNRFFRDNLAADGRFKPAEVLRDEWQAVLAGTSPERVVHQCGSGVSACHNLLAMEYADLPGSRLYPGSWSEWCVDPARPMVL